MNPAAPAFDYGVFTGRNIGFVSVAEQNRLRAGKVFVCGVGGMGGACVQSLVRAGVGRVAIADFDTFDLSNLNRQVFASLRTVGAEKTEATHRDLLAINPELQIEVYGADWTRQIDAILSDYKIVVNGMDDVACGVLLYRKAREHGVTVIDAYTASLPSVTVVRPEDPRPEERLGYPTPALAWDAIGTEVRNACTLKELEYVLTHSSSAWHIQLDVAAELVAGKRPRMSFAPMVITTGNLMCFEAINLLLGRRSGTDWRGYFFNPWKARVELPRTAPVAWVMRLLVRRFMRKLLRGA